MTNQEYQQEYRKALTIKAKEKIEDCSYIMRIMVGKYKMYDVSDILAKINKYKNFIEVIDELSYIGIVEDMNEGKINNER